MTSLKNKRKYAKTWKGRANFDEKESKKVVEAHKGEESKGWTKEFTLRWKSTSFRYDKSTWKVS